ncbi:MAG: serine protease [bacterium]|nr:serine protease [bacterium]
MKNKLNPQTTFDVVNERIDMAHFILAVLTSYFLGCGKEKILNYQSDEKVTAEKLVVSNVAKGSRDRLNQQETAIYELAKKRVVSLVCYRGSLTGFASGFFISSKGHILTTAHAVYDNMLNMDSDCECDVRQGSPATVIGRAKAIFVPKAYKELLGVGNARDAIRYDMAVLEMIPQSFSGEEVSFYSIDPDYRSSIGHEVMMFGYPSEYKSIDRRFNSLNMFHGLSKIENLDYTYVVVNETQIAQGGSSGGVVFDVVDNKFAGLIFGVSHGSDPMRRMLYSLIPWAINSVIFNETQQSLDEFVRDRATTVENKPKSASEEGEILSNNFWVDYSWNLFQIREGVSYGPSLFTIYFMKDGTVTSEPEVTVIRENNPDMVFLVNGSSRITKTVENSRWIHERFALDDWEGSVYLQAGDHTFLFRLDGNKAMPE